MSALRGKADMAVCGSLPSRSLLWAKIDAMRTASLAFPGHGEASIALQLNFEGLRHKTSAVISTNRIANLDDLLRREEPTKLSEGRIVDVAAPGHLFDVAKQGSLLVIEQH